MIINIAKCHCKPGKVEELMELTKFVKEKADADPGVILYKRLRSVEEPDKVCFLEVYKDRAAFDAHLAWDACKWTNITTPALLVNGWDNVKQYEVEPFTDYPDGEKSMLSYASPNYFDEWCPDNN